MRGLLLEVLLVSSWISDCALSASALLAASSALVVPSRAVGKANEFVAACYCTSPASSNLGDEVEILRDLCLRRYFVQRFDASATNKEDEGIFLSRLKECLAIAHRAPTSFNAQPYRVVVVRDPEVRLKLSRSMLGHNADRVRDCGAVVVFLADLNCMRDLNRLRELHSREGRNPKYMGPMGAYLSLFSSGHAWPLRFPLSLAKRMVFGALSRLGYTMPSPDSADAWAAKNTMMVASYFTLAATAAGLDTAAQEGFDMRKLRRCLGIPRRFRIPVVVCVGQSKSPRKAGSVSLRHAPETVFYKDRYGDPLEGVPDLNLRINANNHKAN
jgi:nitroreductase